MKTWHLSITGDLQSLAEPWNVLFFAFISEIVIFSHEIVIWYLNFSSFQTCFICQDYRIIFSSCFYLHLNDIHILHVSPQLTQRKCDWVTVLVYVMTCVICYEKYCNKVWHLIRHDEWVIKGYRFDHILQDCFTSVEAMVWLPQCQWRNPGGYGYTRSALDQTKTPTHSQARPIYIFLEITISIRRLDANNEILPCLPWLPETLYN